MIVEGNEVVVKLAGQSNPQRHRGARPRQRRLPQSQAALRRRRARPWSSMTTVWRRKINGSGNATLVSTTDASETTVTADRVNLDLQPDGNESVLTQVAATGNGVVTSKPLAAPGRQLSETHVLRSETLEMKMRPGGREMESVVTKAPGTLEFLPNLPVAAPSHARRQGLRDRLRPAESPGQLSRRRRKDPHRPDRRGAPPQSPAECDHQPRPGGPLRPQDEPPAEHAADRATSPTRKATARRAPPKPPWTPTRT